jgi:hypothetical protein
MPNDTNKTMTAKVKGISHYQDAASHCRIGDKVTLVPEPDNPHDRNAVRVDCHQRRIGYIAKDLAPRIQPLSRQGRVTAVVSEVVGERRSDFCLGIELLITISPPTPAADAAQCPPPPIRASASSQHSKSSPSRKSNHGCLVAVAGIAGLSLTASWAVAKLITHA